MADSCMHACIHACRDRKSQLRAYTTGLCKGRLHVAIFTKSPLASMEGTEPVVSRRDEDGSCSDARRDDGFRVVRARRRFADPVHLAGRIALKSLSPSTFHHISCFLFRLLPAQIENV